MTSLVIDPGTFEAGVTGWTPTGGSLAQSAAQAHSGSNSALLTVSGSPTQAYIRPTAANRVPVAPFGLYATSVWCRSPTTPSVAAAIDWLGAGGGYLSTTAGTAAVLTANTWAQRTVSGTAPAGAAYAVYGPTAGGSPANGTQLYIDDADFTGVAITAVQQASWPPRMLVSVTGLTLGDDVQIYREVAGKRTLLRGGDGADVTDTSFVRTDAELPFGVPVTYVAIVNTLATYATAPASHTLTGGKVALTDAITGQAAEVVILAAGDRQQDSSATRFKVGDRTVVVAGPWGQPEGTYELFTEAFSSFENLQALLAGSTEGVVQIRQPGGYDGVDDYLAVDQVTVRRWSPDGSDQRRISSIQYAATEPWAAALEARGFTLADIATHYGDPATGTLQDIADDYATLLAVAQGDFS